MNCKISYHAVIRSVESLEPRFAMDHITELSPLVRDRLSGELEAQILTTYATCFEVTSELKNLESDFVKSATSDIYVSCDLLCGYQISSSLSAWHSLHWSHLCEAEIPWCLRPSAAADEARHVSSILRL